MSKIFTKAENQAWQKQLPTKKSSACVAFIDGNKVLMVKASYKSEWTFPGGVVENNESPKEAAVRESYEEVGLTTEYNKTDLLTVVYTRGIDGWLDRYTFFYINNGFSKAAKLKLQVEEIEKAEWVEFKDVAERAEQRGSYINIQELLLKPQKNDSYYSEVL